MFRVFEFLKHTERFAILIRSICLKKYLQNKLFDIRNKFLGYYKKSLKFMSKNSMENPTYFHNILQIFITNDSLIVPKL